jgi:acyl carrier protein
MSTTAISTTTDPLFETVRDILVDCLACDPDDVVPSARFMDELEGESIDVIDFSFRVERALRITQPLKRFQINDRWQFDDQGRALPETRDWLDGEMAALGLPAPEYAQLRTYQDLLTIEFLMAAIRHEVAERDKREGDADHEVA